MRASSSAPSANSQSKVPVRPSVSEWWVARRDLVKPTSASLQQMGAESAVGSCVAAPSAVGVIQLKNSSIVWRWWSHMFATGHSVGVERQ